MTIHTEKPKEETYIRVEVSQVDHRMVEYHGCVGKVVSEGALEAGRSIVFVALVGEADVKVFNGRDIVRITEKEYFKAALRG